MHHGLVDEALKLRLHHFGILHHFVLREEVEDLQIRDNFGVFVILISELLALLFG